MPQPSTNWFHWSKRSCADSHMEVRGERSGHLCFRNDADDGRRLTRSG